MGNWDEKSRQPQAWLADSGLSGRKDPMEVSHGEDQSKKAKPRDAIGNAKGSAGVDVAFKMTEQVIPIANRYYR